MFKLFHSLFGATIKTYTYKASSQRVRQTIESVFDSADQMFSLYDIKGRFTGGDTFLVEAPVSAFTNGVVYRSTLYGNLFTISSGGTIIKTTTRSALSFRIIFWVVIVFGIIYILQYFIMEDSQTIWPGLIFLTIGPFLIAKIADINNAVIEDRYIRYLHKEVLKINPSGCA